MFISIFFLEVSYKMVFLLLFSDPVFPEQNALSTIRGRLLGRFIFLGNMPFLGKGKHSIGVLRGWREPRPVYRSFWNSDGWNDMKRMWRAEHDRGRNEGHWSGAYINMKTESSHGPTRTHLPFSSHTQTQTLISTKTITYHKPCRQLLEKYLLLRLRLQRPPRRPMGKRVWHQRTSSDWSTSTEHTSKLSALFSALFYMLMRAFCH